MTDRTSPLVLVVEDHDDTRTLYAEYLRAAGFRVDVAENGNDALKSALAACPDIIVLDLAMPHLDGWETARLLRSYGKTSSIPIIACTAYGDAYNVERAKDAGCDRFVFKPCSPEDVEAAVWASLDPSR